MTNKEKFRLTITAVLSVLAIWTAWENLTVGVSRYSAASRNVPRPFNGWKIAVVSDLHGAEFGKDNKKLIDLVRAERPDMIAVTGDLIDSDEIDVAAKTVKGLMTVAPCYYVPGNHESRAAEDYEILEEKLRECGTVVLRDRAVRLKKDGEEILIAGLEDPEFTEKDPALQPALLQAKVGKLGLSGGYSILLSHRPEAFDAYVDADADLVLCGHTHGGQVRLPFVGGVIAPNQGFFPKYDAGKFSRRDTTMIISRGLGNSVIPVRINDRPEIAVVELVRAGSGR